MFSFLSPDGTSGQHQLNIIERSQREQNLENEDFEEDGVDYSYLEKYYPSRNKNSKHNSGRQIFSHISGLFLFIIVLLNSILNIQHFL